MFIICLNIFLARLVDVSIGTVRTILMVRGRRNITFILSFFEVLIWFVVVREALVNISDSIMVPISYAGGYACGTYIGSFFTNKFINGYNSVQIITKRDNERLIDNLRKAGYGVSIVNLKKEKNEDKKDMLFVEIKNKNLNELMKLVKKIDNKAFIVVNETKIVQNGLIK